MGIYILTVILTYILAVLATRYGSVDPNNPDNIRPNKIFVYLIMITFIAISGFRYMNYYLSDEWAYRQGFLQMLTNEDFFSLFSEKEWGFALLNWILNRVSSDPQVLIFTVAFITNVFVVLTIAKYGRPFGLSILLYACGAFFASFNIIRQCLAMAIVFWGIRYVLQGEFWKYFLLIFTAAAIHISAWLVLPIYFVVRQRYLSKWFIPLFALALIIMANFQSAAIFFLADGIYGNYLSDIAQGGYGVNPIRVIASFMPLILMIMYKKRLMEINISNLVFINFSIISGIIMLISLIYVYIARIDTFFGIVGVVIIPQLTKIFINNKKLMEMCIFLFYFLFGLYQASISSVYYNILFENIEGTWF